MATIAVKPEILRWAVTRAGLSEEGLQQSHPGLDLAKWLSGELEPNLIQLEKLARVTTTPLGYFFLQAPIAEPLPFPFFRTMEDEHPIQPSTELLDTVYAMQSRQSWLREYLIESHVDPIDIVASINSDVTSDSLAVSMRNCLGLSEDWTQDTTTKGQTIRALKERLESVGLIVVINGIVGNNTHRALDPTEFRGFVLVDNYAPLVFVNGADAKSAQLFTLAHEFAHVLLGTSAVFDLQALLAATDAIEQLCNQAAAEFLVPEIIVHESWNGEKVEESIRVIAQRTKTSPIVAARRALALGIIQRNAFFDFYNRYMDEWRVSQDNSNSGGDFYKNQTYRVGKPFTSFVLSAVREGKLLYREAYQLLGIHGRTFDEYARRSDSGEL